MIEVYEDLGTVIRISKINSFHIIQVTLSLCHPACPVLCLSVSYFASFFLSLCVSDSLTLSLLVRLCQSVSLCFNMFIYLARYLDKSIIRCIHLSIILSWYLSISPLALFLHDTLPNNVLLL